MELKVFNFKKKVFELLRKAVNSGYVLCCLEKKVDEKKVEIQIKTGAPY